MPTLPSNDNATLLAAFKPLAKHGTLKDVEFGFRDGFRPEGKTDVNAAGRALFNLNRRLGHLPNEAIVDEAKNPDSPLHPLFIWDDARAAEEHRLITASKIANNLQATITIEYRGVDRKMVFNNVFVSVKAEHVPAAAATLIDVEYKNGAKPGWNARARVLLPDAMNDVDQAKDAFEDALADLQELRDKYRFITQMQPLLQVIGRFLAKWKHKIRKAKKKKTP